MSNNHTPGPWWVDDDGFIAAGSGDNYITIAEGLAPSENIDEMAANLWLLAAAPELLDALQELFQSAEYLAIEKFDDAAHKEAFEAILARARAVISKVKGE